MVAAEILEEKKKKEEDDLMFDDIGAETGQVKIKLYFHVHIFVRVM